MRRRHRIEVDRVRVLVNGRMPEQYSFTTRKHRENFRDATKRFEETARAAPQQDAHLIVATVGENSDLTKGWGLNPQGKMRPTAFTDPIYVDVDRNGFQPNGTRWPTRCRRR